MLFMLDENVPMDVADMLTRLGHKVEWIRTYSAPGSPDPLVATISQDLEAVLVSFDGDFQNIAPRVAVGSRRRFKKLSRIWMRCSEPQAAQRLERALELVISEHKIAKSQKDVRMHMWVASGYFRTDR